jgi:CRISPR/Cas system-associated exonuclease Cas4 (RecB family)
MRLGVGRPSSFPLTLNNAVDFLMKKEFDIHRANGEAHPLMKTYGIDAVPLDHEQLEEWRDALKRGISTVHKESNLLLRGGVDDVWVTPKGEFIIVDYKATSKDEEITLDDEWKIQYKRQMEIYQWLFKQNGFKVSDTGYFVYVNGKTDKKAFDGKLEFDVTIIPYTGNSDWVPDVLMKMKECLMSEELPEANPNCDYCSYRDSAGKSIMEIFKKRKGKAPERETLFK